MLAIFKDDNQRLMAGVLPTDHRVGTRSASVDNWPDPVPFGRVEVPSFPVQFLPAWMQRFVDALAVQLQVAPDLVAMCAISAAFTVCARRFWISPRPEWMVPANIWTLTMLASGNRKTAAFGAAIKPLEDFEAERAEELREQIAAQHSQLRILRFKLARAEKAAADAKSPEEGRVAAVEAEDLARQVTAFRVTPFPRLFLSEMTSEGIEELLAEQGKAAMLADESGLLGLLAGRYSAGKAPPNLDPYLVGYEGRTVRIGRMKQMDGSGGGRFAKAAVVTLGLVPQPDVALPLLRSSSAFLDTGFAWRFLFSMPHSTVGHQNPRAVAAPREVIEEYGKMMREMLAMPEPAHDADGETIPVLHATLEANEALLTFEESLQPQLRPDGDLACLGSWGNKLPAQIVRLAGLFHAAEHRREPWARPLALETMQRALKLAPYFVAHAKAARLEMHLDANTKRAMRAVDWMRRTKAQRFSKAELHVAIAKNGGEGTAKDLDRVIEELVGFSFIRAAPTEPARQDKKGGRPKGPGYMVNPKIHEVPDAS